MISNSVPSALSDTTTSSGDRARHRAAGTEAAAGQDGAMTLLDQLARSYAFNLSVAFAGTFVASGIAFLDTDPMQKFSACGWVAFCFSVVLINLAKNIEWQDEADLRSEKRLKTIARQGREIKDLQQDKEFLIAERDEWFPAAGAGAAAGTPVSEKHQDVSAAVVEFPKGAGV